jgi:hypothetical protein
MMAKHVAAFVGLSLLIIPWLVSVAAVFQFGELATDVRSSSIEATAAKSTLLAILYKYVLGGLSAMLGILVLGFCVDGMEYRPKWLFWTLLALGLIWLPFYAAGTMLGIAVILYTSLNYRSFYPTGNAT